MDTILRGGVFLLSATEAVEVGGYAYILKPQISQEQDELCLRQSAGDSTGPQINVMSSVLAELGIEHDICKLQSPTRT